MKRNVKGKLRAMFKEYGIFIREINYSRPDFDFCVYQVVYSVKGRREFIADSFDSRIEDDYAVMLERIKVRFLKSLNR